MNQMLEELYQRKSVRVYKDRPIEAKEKACILKAALEAPSAGNMTLYSVIDVTDQKLKEKLVVTCDNQPFIAAAPMVLVFCADYQKWYDLFCSHEEMVRTPGMGDYMLAFSDALIAAQNAVTAAWSMGIGSCYIGDILERYEVHSELFGLPEYVVPAAMVVFGYPVSQQVERKKPARFSLEAVVFENTYCRLSSEVFANAVKERQELQEEAFDRWLSAFCKRKWNSGFSVEMCRSVKVMTDSWMKALNSTEKGEDNETDHII